MGGFFPSGSTVSFPRAAAAAPAPAASTVIWSVDLTAEASHDFTSVAADSWGGITWTAENASNASEFQIINGTGLAMDSTAASSYYNATFTAPQIACNWSDLMALAAGAAYDPSAIYALVMVLAAGSATPAGNYEGPFVGLRTDRATAGEDCNLQYLYNGASAQVARTFRGATSINNDPTIASITGLTAPRSLVVVNARHTFQHRMDDGSLIGDPFGGVVTTGGWLTVTSGGGDAGNGMYRPGGGTPTLDLSAVGAEAYIGFTGKATGSRFIITDLELHEFVAS